MEGDRITREAEDQFLIHLVVHTELALRGSAYIPFFLLYSGGEKSFCHPGESCTSPIPCILLSSKPSFSFPSRENLLWQKAARLLTTKYSDQEVVPSDLRNMKIQTAVVSWHQSSLTPHVKFTMSSLRPRCQPACVPKRLPIYVGRVFSVDSGPFGGIYPLLPSSVTAMDTSLFLWVSSWTVSGLRLWGRQRSPIYAAVGSSAELLGVCVYQIFLPHIITIIQQSRYNNMTVILINRVSLDSSTVS